MLRSNLGVFHPLGRDQPSGTEKSAFNALQSTLGQSIALGRPSIPQLMTGSETPCQAMAGMFHEGVPQLGCIRKSGRARSPFQSTLGQSIEAQSMEGFPENDHSRMVRVIPLYLKDMG